MADEESGLEGAEVVGGAVVRIDGDLAPLEAKAKQAKAITERIDGLKATVKISADDSELLKLVSSTDRLVSSGKGLTLVPKLDESAVLRQSQALLDKVRDQWSAGLVITPRFAVPPGGIPAILPGTNAAGGAPLPSGGYGPGGVFVSSPSGPPQPRAALPFYGTAQYLAPGSVITFEHDEYTSPLSKVNTYSCCTNSAAFLGFDPHMVLSRPIEAESFYSGTRWHVRYTFEVCPDPLGWQQVFLWHDLYTGRVPSDVSGTDGSNGILIADPYQKLGRTADFNSLSLPIGLLTS